MAPAFPTPKEALPGPLDRGGFKIRRGITMKPFDDMTKFSEKAELLKTIAHPVRLCIVQGLMEQGECNVNHMQSCLKIPQSTISQHLAKMRTCGVLKCRRDGVEVYYQVANEVICQVVRALFANNH